MIVYVRELEAKWGKNYPLVIKLWINNWYSLSNFSKYPPNIKSIIYTTNPIEIFHNQKRVFSSDMALIKIWYLAMQDISNKWVMPIHNWGLTLSQLAIIFEGRIELDLKL